MHSKVAAVGKYGLGMVGCLVMLSLPALFLVGAEILGEFVLPWLLLTCPVVLGLSALVVCPLAIFRVTRPWAGLVMVIGSYVFGLTAWFLGFLLTLDLWGPIAVIIGLFIFGVGIVPIAMLATLLNAMWLELGILSLAILLTFGYRIGGYGLVEAGEAGGEFA